MSDSRLVAQGIRERLTGGGPRLLLAPPELLRELQADPAPGELSLLCSPLKPRKLRGLSGVAVLRAAPLELPLARGSLAAVVAAGVLGRTEDAAAALEAWRRLLRPGGQLLLVERLSVSPALRALSRARLAPEDLTRLLLNAGFGDIRQRWTRPGGGSVITSGVLRDLG